MAMFGVDKEVVEILKKQVHALELERDLWRDKYLGLKEVQKQETPQVLPTKEAPETGPIEAFSLALARGGGLVSPNKLTAWRAARVAEYRQDKVALSTGPLESIKG